MREEVERESRELRPVALVAVLRCGASGFCPLGDEEIEARHLRRLLDARLQLGLDALREGTRIAVLMAERAWSTSHG